MQFSPAFHPAYPRRQEGREFLAKLVIMGQRGQPGEVEASLDRQPHGIDNVLIVLLDR